MGKSATVPDRLRQYTWLLSGIVDDIFQLAQQLRHKKQYAGDAMSTARRIAQAFQPLELANKIAPLAGYYSAAYVEMCKGAGPVTPAVCGDFMGESLTFAATIWASGFGGIAREAINDGGSIASHKDMQDFSSRVGEQPRDLLPRLQMEMNQAVVIVTRFHPALTTDVQQFPAPTVVNGELHLSPEEYTARHSQLMALESYIVPREHCVTNTALQNSFIGIYHKLTSNAADTIPDGIITALSNQERRLYDYMQERTSATFDELIDARVFDDIADASIKQAVKRLNKKLVDTKLSYGIKSRSIVRE